MRVLRKKRIKNLCCFSIVDARCDALPTSRLRAHVKCQLRLADPQSLVVVDLRQQFFDTPGTAFSRQHLHWRVSAELKTRLLEPLGRLGRTAEYPAGQLHYVVGVMSMHDQTSLRGLPASIERLCHTCDQAWVFQMLAGNAQ